MGCGASEEVKASRKLDAQLAADAKAAARQTKLLLLGAGQSGKSTVVKQMKVLHMSGYTREEVNRYKNVVAQNISEVTEQLLFGMQRLEIDLESDDAKSLVERFVSDGRITTEASSTDKYDLAQALWADSGAQSAFARRSEFQLNDAAPYFFGNLKRMRESGYAPTTEDILRCRVRTTGITETHFNLAGLNITLVDVGGQRNERKKWIHQFEGVTAILFVVAMSEYDQKLFEDESQNRLHESLTLFESTVNNKFFEKSATILFLNKEDLFREKLAAGIPLTIALPEYKGPNEFEPASEFITTEFQKRCKDPHKTIYRHFTTATDTNNIKVVILAVKDIITGNNLRDLGLS